MFSWNLNCSSLPKDYISGLWIQLPRWLIIREMQIKTTVRYHFTLVRMGIIKKTTNEKCCWVREGREPYYTVGGKGGWCSHYGKQRRYLKDLKTELWHDSAIPLLGIYPNKMEIIIWKDMSTPICIAALPTIAKIWN